MKVEGLDTLEINVMKVEFTAPMITQEVLDSSTKQRKSCPIMSMK